MVRSSHHDRLKAFLAHADRAEGTLGYHELQGFLFTVQSCPDVVPPSEWMPIVFGGESPEYADLAEAQHIVSDLMAVYNEVNDGIRPPLVALPADCQFRRDVLANLEPDAPVSQWCRGFVMGHQWLEESWESLVPDDLEQEFTTSLVTLSFFASAGLAREFATEVGRADDVAGMAASLRRLFPDAMTSYATLGRSIGQVLRESESKPAPAPSAPRVGRNDPCPCGSGKKYKKCCGSA